MTPKWFKIRSYSIIRDSSLFFNINSQARYILTVQRTTSSLYHPLTLPPTPLMTKLKHARLSVGF